MKTHKIKWPEVSIDTRMHFYGMADHIITIAGQPGTYRVKHEDMDSMRGDFMSRFFCIMRNIPVNAYSIN
ncbi:hypothetical protein [Pseudomonas sp.]|uniref:hypothetical protein n=1 Tax=Pseudomonas sp. TaxID=306 RepID=UPI003FD82598